MDFEIHQLEQEAYSSVLRAFRAQSDAVTWEKESLIATLRKELRVSDDEHRELSAMVDADDTVCKIREWRQGGGHDLLASPTTSFQKRQKASRSSPHAYSMPIQDIHTQSVSASMQQTPSVPKRGSGFGRGGKRPNKPGPYYSGFPSMRSTEVPFPGTGQLTNQTSSSGALTNFPSEAATRNPLVGKKVMTRWPEDNTFYEAVIRDYNPIEGRHALVYDINTPKETWEWMDLKEISSEDIRWVGSDPGIARHGGLGISNFLAGREKGSADNQLAELRNGVEREPDEIEILDTETLIQEVEKVFDTSHPDLLEIKKAKKMLKEHEQALISVIEKLADSSDTESDGDHQVSREQEGRETCNSAEPKL